MEIWAFRCETIDNDTKQNDWKETNTQKEKSLAATSHGAEQKGNDLGFWLLSLNVSLEPPAWLVKTGCWTPPPEFLIQWI